MYLVLSALTSSPIFPAVLSVFLTNIKVCQYVAVSTTKHLPRYPRMAVPSFAVSSSQRREQSVPSCVHHVPSVVIAMPTEDMTGRIPVCYGKRKSNPGHPSRSHCSTELNRYPIFLHSTKCKNIQDYVYMKLTFVTGPYKCPNVDRHVLH